MNLKARVLMHGKAIAVWWGIFLIIGCCIGFCMNTLNGLLFNISTEIKMYFVVPCIAAGSLIFAVTAYAISSFINKRPQKKLRKQLDKACEDGISQEYLSLLAANCRGEMKSRILIEQAISDMLCGKFQEASERIDILDILSVLDIANSTGNYYTAAYYYAVKAALELHVPGGKPMEVFESGKFYLSALDKDTFVTSVYSLCLFFNGEEDCALEIMKNADNSRKKLKASGKYPLIQAFSLASKAGLMKQYGKYREAEAAVLEAMEIKVSKPFEDLITDLGRSIKELEKAETVNNV
ncbi:MAG: hypothetical protein IJ007_06265 [Oscillospiraceae bacterium]|nr:hypothetical protein [Oscillospiraceae bacterium]